MGDPDDIEQQRFMRFISDKAGSRHWYIKGHPKPTLTLPNEVGIPRRTFEKWRKEYTEKFGCAS